MEPPIWLQYRLTNFYQNYNSYFMSRDSMQLRGMTDSSECMLDGSGSVGIGVCSSGQHLSPCGLFAQSLFNDSYQIVQQDNCTCDENLISDEFSCETQSCVHRTPTLIQDDLGYDEDFYANHENYPKTNRIQVSTRNVSGRHCEFGTRCREFAISNVDACCGIFRVQETCCKDASSWRVRT